MLLQIQGKAVCMWGLDDRGCSLWWKVCTSCFMVHCMDGSWFWLFNKDGNHIRLILPNQYICQCPEGTKHQAAWKMKDIYWNCSIPCMAKLTVLFVFTICWRIPCTNVGLNLLCMTNVSSRAMVCYFYPLWMTAWFLAQTKTRLMHSLQNYETSWIWHKRRMMIKMLLLTWVLISKKTSKMELSNWLNLDWSKRFWSHVVWPNAILRLPWQVLFLLAQILQVLVVKSDGTMHQ